MIKMATAENIPFLNDLIDESKFFKFNMCSKEKFMQKEKGYLTS